MIKANAVEYWASLGYADMVKEAIAEGHDVNARGENGYTALHAAVVNGHVDVVQLLLQNGANPDAQLDSGESPLDLARMTQNQEVIDALTSSSIAAARPE